MPKSWVPLGGPFLSYLNNQLVWCTFQDAWQPEPCTLIRKPSKFPKISLAPKFENGIVVANAQTLSSGLIRI